MFKKYKAVLVECKQSAKDNVGDILDLIDMKELSTDYFWTCAKKCRNGYDGDTCLGLDKETWFELEKAMWKKHWSVYRDRLKYISNDIVKPFQVGIM